MDWLITVIVVLAAFLLLALLSGGDENRKCAWFDGTKIKFKNGKKVVCFGNIEIRMDQKIRG